MATLDLVDPQVGERGGDGRTRWSLVVEPVWASSRITGASMQSWRSVAEMRSMRGCKWTPWSIGRARAHCWIDVLTIRYSRWTGGGRCVQRAASARAWVLVDRARVGITRLRTSHAPMRGERWTHQGAHPPAGRWTIDGSRLWIELRQRTRRRLI